MLNKLETGSAFQMSDIPLCPGDEIVYGENFVAFSDQPIAQMGTDKSGSPRYEITQWTSNTQANSLRRPVQRCQSGFRPMRRVRYDDG
ncbi:MAG: hypothetical protein QM757_38910, partial [Paludibaculum sp.]